MIISVFGSASVKPIDTLYTDAYNLGKALAQSGHDVITGGYMGTMEAVSKGANDFGGHVIGVTCEEIEAYRPAQVNPWVKEEWKTKSLIERLELVTRKSDAAIVLPGGVGTLVELGLTWNQIIIKAIKAIPFIVIGRGWEETIKMFIENQNDYIAQEHKELLFFAKDVNSAMILLDDYLTNKPMRNVEK